MRSCQEASVVEKVEDVDEEKKSRCRSNSCSKQNGSLVSVSCSMNEIQGESLVSENLPSSIEDVSSNQDRPESLFEKNDSNCATNAAFHSMSAMHINEETCLEEMQMAQNLAVSGSDEEILSKSCPQSVAYRRPSEGCSSKDSQTLIYNESNLFNPYWPTEDVNNALERGEIFHAVFRVNAHNSLEAYCTIENVPVDILICGVPAQNRAIEGDMVAIEVGPLRIWKKMKGSTRLLTDSAPTGNSRNSSETSEMSENNCKGKNKADKEFGSACGSNTYSSDRFFDQDSKGISAGCLPFSSDGPNSDCADVSCQIEDSIDKLCGLISSNPSKRPIGRVVSIIKRSPRREVIVGFLSVKLWSACEKENQNNAKKNKNPETWCIGFMPNDARFPKMKVHVEDLPDCIKKRLRDNDENIERELVAAQIIDWNEESYIPQARVLQVFGLGIDIQPNIDAILYQSRINSSDFSTESISCLPSAPWEIPRSEYKTRVDLRSLCVFSIDPSTATDLDDALSVEILADKNYRVGVHIADVSYFVKPDTQLDLEAQVRSTSVYMSRQKLPMLPTLLSEDLGSLCPGHDKLAFSIFWDIDSSGNILSWWIGRTVIYSCCKLSYENAQDILDNINYADNSDGLPQLYGSFNWYDVVRSVKKLDHVASLLKEKRLKSGALHFECSKIMYLFDEYGIPYDSKLIKRRDSNFLVEEFMLLANCTAAEVILRAFPEAALLRRHPKPNMRKLKEFEAFCSKHGLQLDASSSFQLHRSLEQARETLKDDTVLLEIIISHASRPMQLAMYFCTGELKDNEDDWGHYALAVPFYTHFTSPLRRYVDILVHRMMAAALEAEESYLNQFLALGRKPDEAGNTRGQLFTGLHHDRKALESEEAREAFSVAAVRHKIPCQDILKGMAAHCNERKRASRYVKDACDKLYMWVLLKKKEVLISEARVLALGPKFMSIYVPQLTIERRIYYDGIEGLTAKWLPATSTLLLDLSERKSSRRTCSARNRRPLEESVLVVTPSELDPESNCCPSLSCAIGNSTLDSYLEIQPLAFPMTVSLMSKISIALHAVGGEGSPMDICARLYGCSYLM
ncbi:hypothetical protein SAY87_020567 [Trapa incisa]|uniref:DIS3-like exonuclease 2 n=1 Tax=Trapa incisa TaxID=236973 RepID=A0AAN7JQ15_9MYRT|nr:hypothetical protein SAY87_020567 [Trapa incisa]